MKTAAPTPSQAGLQSGLGEEAIMKVRIVRQPTGLINGVEWPAVGEEIDLPKSVAEPMAEVGDVEIVAETRPASKTAGAKKVEKRG
jgi:hypothetical protein